MKFEISNDKEEITKVISKAKAKGQNILWQTHEDHRAIFEMVEFQHDPVREIIKFKLVGEGNLNFDEYVYLKFSHRNTIFKGMILREQDEYFYMKAPDEVHVEELREFPRYSFDLDEKRCIEVSIPSQIMSNSFENQSLKLIDISQSGMALLLYGKNEQRILDIEGVTLSNLGNFEFKSKVHLEPVYSIDIKEFDTYGDHKLFKKVGIKFKDKLPDHLITKFIKYEEGQFEHELGFLGDNKKFRKKISREYQDMFDRLRKNKTFDSFARELQNVDRDDNKYLVEHIKLLAITSCALAKLIGIGDQLAFEQLIYASYIHDIGFFQNQNLAQIKDKDHFKKILNSLTVEEKELYYRAPTIALEYALSDPQSPGGCENILSQYRDIINASNIENFFRKGGISPLTIVFYVAHDLTDYILTHPQWTFYEYLQSYKFATYGATFVSIFEQLALAKKAA